MEVEKASDKVEVFSMTENKWSEGKINSSVIFWHKIQVLPLKFEVIYCGRYLIN